MLEFCSVSFLIQLHKVTEEESTRATPVATVMVPTLVLLDQSGIAAVWIAPPLFPEWAVAGAKDVQIKSIIVDLQ